MGDAGECLNRATRGVVRSRDTHKSVRKSIIVLGGHLGEVVVQADWIVGFVRPWVAPDDAGGSPRVVVQ